jgi:hypothetical protein
MINLSLSQPQHLPSFRIQHARGCGGGAATAAEGTQLDTPTVLLSSQVAEIPYPSQGQLAKMGSFKGPNDQMS